MRKLQPALPALLLLILTVFVGCKVIEDSDPNRDGSSVTDERVDVNALPINVSAAVKGVMPNAVITSAKKEPRRGKVVYSLDVKDGQKSYEVVVAPDGTILSTKPIGR